MNKASFVCRLNYHIHEANLCFARVIACLIFSAIAYVVGSDGGPPIFTIFGAACLGLCAIFTAKNFIHRTHAEDMRAIAHLHGVDLKAPSESATASSDTSATRTTSV